MILSNIVVRVEEKEDVIVINTIVITDTFIIRINRRLAWRPIVLAWKRTYDHWQSSLLLYFFNAGLSPKRYWQGPRSQKLGRGGGGGEGGRREGDYT